jgi:threonine aldolase
VPRSAPDDPHDPITALVMLENTHSDSMGQPLPADYVDAVAEVAHAGGVPLHVDGARIFNASVALGEPVSRLLAAADSATFCLSKGLACPVGSLVVGSATSSGARAARASCSAAACARSACSRRPA